MSMQSPGVMISSLPRSSWFTRSRGGLLIGAVVLLLAATFGAFGFATLIHAQAHKAAAANANTAVTTYKGDVARDGDYPNETTLNTGNVNATKFGKRVSYPVDGQVYAQPLFVPNVTIGGSAHNVVFVATEHDSVYAFDADATSAISPLWHRNFLGTNVTTIPAVDVYGKYPNHDIDPEIGITGTPVIDASAGTLYLVAATKENGSTYVQRLHALDITSGNERSGSPVAITASVTGTGDASSGGKVSFAADKNNQRVGLLLLAGNVYISWSSYGDTDPYHGWVIGYNAGTLAQTAAFADTPNGSEGGIWMGGGGLAAGPAGNTIYLASGNGTFDLNSGGSDGGDTIYKLDTSLHQTDYFTPFNQLCLSQGDSDLGSGGVVVLPHEASAAAPDTLLGGGKEGRLYLLNRSSMGGYTAISNPCSNQNLTNVDKVVQELPAGTISGGVYSTPAYWQGPSAQYIYEVGQSDHLKAFTFNGLLSTSPSSQSSETFSFPGGNPAVSSNGSTAGTGIVWTIAPGSPGVLRAYDATNLATELYNSGQNASRDALAGFVKFSVPTVGNGRVYVGTGTDVNSTDSGTLDIYGLLSSGTTNTGYAVNSGGSAAGSFAADNYVSGGTVATPVTNTISTTGVLNPAPQAVYQTERYGNFTYTFPGLKAGSAYLIRLHFDENYWTAAGQRSFNVSINGASVLSNFDIFAAAGGQYKAIVKDFTTTADSSGNITIQYTTVKDNAKSSGIEVIPIDYAVNSGGGAAGYFAADGFFSGTSQTASFTAAVDTSQVPSPAPQAVYQTERYGNFTYTFPGLKAGGSYYVRLHFSENYWTAAGQRVFNVSINGGAVLSNFDIFAAAGGQNKAIVREFAATADSSGTITIQYTTVTDHAKSDGIEISG